MFSSLSVPWLKGHPVRVYRPVELNLLSSKMADIYVLWLFQALLANYSADQSVAQAASCFHPLWQFVSQACCSAADAVGVRASLRCSCRSAVMETMVGASYLWCGLGIGVEGFCKYVCIYCIHTPYVWIPVCTYRMLEHVCVFVYIAHLSNQLEDLGCFPIQTPVSLLCYINNRAAHSVFTQCLLHCTRDAYGLWSQSCIGNELGCCKCIFFPTPFLCRHNSLPRALCFISLSRWWILGCHAEIVTLSIMLY